jgi:SAM-dependent methyltransferase
MSSLRIESNDALARSSDLELIESTLNPATRETIVELGCGTALVTRQLAERFPTCRFIAFEVDEIQHAKNRNADAPSNLEFRRGGAQAIELADGSVDAVVMLKSLHHVPLDWMGRALDEIARVLRRNGLAYLSEPVYAGAFNEILRLFHDERRVREAAFSAIVHSIDRKILELDREIHFLSASRFVGFEEFEDRVIGATHTEFDIDHRLREQVRAAFLRHLDDEGVADFLNPMRVDVLRKP